MSDSTGIEWTDATWNPTRGCSRVSEGCRNCYAETMAARFSGPGAPYQGLTRDGKWTGKIALAEDKLVEPLHWKKPRKIFVNSMSDLFHEGVPDEFVDRVFAVMALCPQHTFQVLTKRPERMRAYLGSEFRSPGFETPRRVNHAMGEWREAFPSHRGWADIVDGWAWPLPNVWLGVSVEDQGTADARIPELVRTPAAVRFVSYEPALGPVDLVGWGDAAMRNDPANEPETWAGYPWPEWVPADQRKQVEDFWSESYRRNPRQWMESAKGAQVPALGARIGAVVGKGGWGELCPARSPLATVTGRYLHSWNNIGRVVTDDGQVVPVSSHCGTNWLSEWIQPDGSYKHRLHWIICGGESGPGARPCDVGWIRSAVQQCAAAGVACFVKQLGAQAAVSAVTKSAGREFRHLWPRGGGFWPEDDGGNDWILRMRDRKGGDPAEWPANLRVREFPAAQKRA